MDGETHGGKKLRLPHPLIGEDVYKRQIMVSEPMKASLPMTVLCLCTPS